MVKTPFRKLSSPLIRILDSAFIMPLYGVFDPWLISPQETLQTEGTLTSAHMRRGASASKDMKSTRVSDYWAWFGGSDKIYCFKLLHGIMTGIGAHKHRK